MAFSNKDLAALRLLLKEEVSLQLLSFQREFREFRGEVLQSFDALFQRDEKREQEYLAMRSQLSVLESKIV